MNIIICWPPILLLNNLAPSMIEEVPMKRKQNFDQIMGKFE